MGEVYIYKDSHIVIHNLIYIYVATQATDIGRSHYQHGPWFAAAQSKPLG